MGTVLESLVASWLALAPAAAGPEQTPPPSEEADLSEAQRLFDVGTARYDAADYNGAIEAFTQALTELRGQGVDDFRIRGLLMFNIGRTHMRAFEIDEQTEHLKQAKSIFTRFIEEAEEHDGQVDASDIEEAKANLIEIDRLMKGETSEPVAEPEPRDKPRDGSRDKPRDGSRDRPPPDPARLRASGIGLTAAGGVLLAGGIGMLGFGAWFGPHAEAQVAPLDDLGLPPDSPAFADREDFLAAERRKGVAWMASGGVAATVGVVALALGVRQLVRAKRANETKVGPTASFGREGAWIGLVGRF